MATTSKPAQYWLRAPNGKVYDPLPSQYDFHADEVSKYRWYVGGMGAGKTLSGCVEAFTMAMAYPGSRGLVSRWTHRELMNTTWRTLKAIIPPAFILASAESAQKIELSLRAPNGQVSTIVGAGLSNMDAVFSAEYAWIYLDEGGQIPPKHGPYLWKLIESRLRGPIGPYRAWVTGNPNGRDWLWKKFVGQGLGGYTMFRAPTRQNVHNPDGYEANLRRGADSNWVRRFLDAEFNEFEGSVYWNFKEDTHVFTPFDVPAHWPTFLAMDWGLSDPCAAYLMVTDEQGVIYVIDEYYRANRLVSDQCKEILEMVGGRSLDWAVIDPSADRADQVTGETLLDQYRKGGLPVFKANNRLFDGIAKVQEALKVDEERDHPLTGQPGAPRLLISRKCPRLIEQLSSYRWGPDGKPMKGDDHAVDALRYGIVRGPHKAEPVVRETMRASAKAFWDDIASEEGWGSDLPQIGAGPGGRMVAA